MDIEYQPDSEENLDEDSLIFIYLDESIFNIEYQLNSLNNDKSGKKGVYESLSEFYGYFDNLESDLKSVKRIFKSILDLLTDNQNVLQPGTGIKIFEFIDSKTYPELVKEESAIIAEITKLINSQ